MTCNTSGWRSWRTEESPLDECDLRGGVTFLLGAEREGLPAELERDLEATIPVEVESLNVAVTGAIALYEWRRQNSVPPTL